MKSCDICQNGKIWISTQVKRVCFLFLIGQLLLPAFPTFAAKMFLQIDGVEGESQIPHHEKEIDVLAFTGGFSYKDGNENLVIKKALDSSSSTLWRMAANNESAPGAVLTVLYNESGEKNFENFRIELEEVYVTSVSMEGSGDEGNLTEAINLKFKKASWIYANTAGTPVVKPAPGGNYGWNIKQNKRW